MTDSLNDFLDPVDTVFNKIYEPEQLGAHIISYQHDFPDISTAELIIIGCNEWRGSSMQPTSTNTVNFIRQELYELFHWHDNIKIADIGNIKKGASLTDTYFALSMMFNELIKLNKRIILIGGSADLTLAMYKVYEMNKALCEAVIIDALIAMNMHSDYQDDKYLIPLLTNEPNYLTNFHHLGMQSFLNRPSIVEMISKMNTDCSRLGELQQNLENFEPVIRNGNFLSFNVRALQQAVILNSSISPNGLNGSESCRLMQFAGMNPNMLLVGLFGFLPNTNDNNMPAKQIAQMLWYFIDGVYNSRVDTDLKNIDNFNHFQFLFSDYQIAFIQSKITGRWWYKMPNKTFVACNYKDYEMASHNEIPNTWIKAFDRIQVAD
ncbi:MAG: hypothetical protein QM528_02295 [Phycisphaerales bacterium]|nr:hypothetical protein [Phycisphaerales bacterium]